MTQHKTCHHAGACDCVPVWTEPSAEYNERDRPRVELIIGESIPIAVTFQTTPRHTRDGRAFGILGVDVVEKPDVLGLLGFT